MIERTPILNIATHAILVFGLILILVPIMLPMTRIAIGSSRISTRFIRLRPASSYSLANESSMDASLPERSPTRIRL